jgi:hypothetical protein
MDGALSATPVKAVTAGVHLASTRSRTGGVGRNRSYVPMMAICTDIFPARLRPRPAFAQRATTENRGVASSILALAIRQCPSSSPQLGPWMSSSAVSIKPASPSLHPNWVIRHNPLREHNVEKVERRGDARVLAGSLELGG